MLWLAARAFTTLMLLHSACLNLLRCLIVIASLVSMDAVPRLNGCYVIIFTNDKTEPTAVMTWDKPQQ